MDELRKAEEQIIMTTSSRYYVYGPHKSYVNKMERMGKMLKKSPTQILIDKHTGRVARLTKGKVKAELKQVAMA